MRVICLRDKRQWSEAHGHEQQAQSNQTRFSQFPDQAADDRATLHCGADDAAVGEQVTHVCFVEVIILIDQQSKRGFKTGKGKGGQKKYGDQQSDLWPLHRVNPLTETRALRGVLGVGLAAFRQQTKRQNKIARAQTGGHPARSGLSEQLCRECAQRTGW